MNETSDEESITLLVKVPARLKKLEPWLASKFHETLEDVVNEELDCLFSDDQSIAENVSMGLPHKKGDDCQHVEKIKELLEGA